MLSVLFVPSSAAAQKCSGEDVAAIDQYCELLPTAEGQAPSDEPQRGLMTVLPVAERQQLWRAGPAGRALLSMPTGAHLHGRDRKPRPLPGAAAAISGWLAERDQAEDSPVRAIGTAAWDGDRLSELFRWLMLMSTVGLVGTAWVRRRR
ncbi:MAG TPA: hypothetical protein VNT03_20085 [Baekduia sp.]|nr:hypothetical protein [Baekduia sp.]